MSISGSIIIVITILVRSLCYHQVPKKVFQYLWGLAIATLLMPLSFTFMNELLPQHQSILIGNKINEVSSNVLMMNDRTNILENRNLHFSDIILCVYAIGLILFVVYFVIKYCKVKRMINEAIPLSEGELFMELKKNLKRKRVKLYYTDRIQSPISFGIIHPKIILPKTFDMSDINKAELILLHELYHIRNVDLIKKYLSLIALIVHFFNPFVWMMYILFNRDIEAHCDEKVVSYLGLDCKKEYALCLLSYVGKKSGDFICTQHFAKNALEERIISIMKSTNKKRRFISFLFISIGIVMFIGLKTVDIQSKLDVETFCTVSHKGHVHKKNDSCGTYSLEYFNEHFAGMVETDLILELPGGGWVQGHSIEYRSDEDYEKGIIHAVLDSTTDPRAETIAQLRERLVSKNPQEAKWKTQQEQNL